MATKIKNSNLDNTIITGLTTTEDVATTDQAIIYDASTGSLRKITQQNLLGFPTITSVSPTSVNDGDGTGNHTFVITGKALTGGSAALVNTNGATVNFDTVTVNSDTQITGIIAKGSLPGSGEPYDVRVTGSNSISSTLANQINIDQSPTYNTASGSLGSVADGARGSTNLFAEAFDPESAGNVTFEIQSGSLPAGCTLSAVHENGVSKAKFSGFNAVGSNTTSNFVLRAVDAASNTSSRAFSIQVLAPTSESFTSSGTFSVPSGLTSASVLIVAGGGSGAAGHSANNAGAGGGGAGGLIFMPGYPVTPGGTITVTVGCGGGPRSSQGFGNNGQDSAFGSPGDPGLGSGGVLTAKGGGHGYVDPGSSGNPGGSGGGANGHYPGGSTPDGGGLATQPTQPGNSGAYGFGNNGGGSSPGTGSPARRAGGGGGAGAAGSKGCNYAGQGGDGKAYTIADGTTSVYYAAGGGGGSCAGNTSAQGGNGGGGGGGSPSGASGSGTDAGASGTANRGSGGGGGGNGGNPGGAGGKGVVIVRY